MKKITEKFYKRMQYILYAIIGIVAVLFFAAGLDNPEAVGAVLMSPVALAWITSEGKFKKLSEEQIKELSVDDLAAYYNRLNAEKQKELEEKIEQKIGKDEIESFMKDFADTKDKQMNAMNELLKLQGLEIKKLKSKEAEVLSKDEFKEALAKTCKNLQERPDRPTQIVDVKGKKLYVKAVGTMTFGNSVTGTIPQADREPGFNDFNKRLQVIRAASNVGRTMANVVEWVYKAAKEGGAGMTAEGSAKTQLDWTYVVDSANVRKITSYIKISKEMLDDIEGIMSDINGELKYEIDYLEETQLITGTGVAPNLNGIELYAQPLDNTALAGTIPVPNKWDVLGAAITQIDIETEGRSEANVIFMNPADVFAMVHGTKDTTNDYIAPVTVDAGGTRIHGLPVVKTNSVTAGEFIVAAMNKFNIKDREELSIAIGYDSDDWTKNLVTILGEKRLVSYVKKNDEDAFVTDTFSDGITFLTAST